jgi:hypothetical protein
MRSGFKASDQVQGQGVPRIENGAYTSVREYFDPRDNTAIGLQMGFETTSIHLAMIRPAMHKSQGQPEPSNKWLIFSLVAVGIFMSTLDGSIVNVALPTIMAELSIPLITVKWVVVIYLLTISSLLLSFGRLSDMRGRRWH